MPETQSPSPWKGQQREGMQGTEWRVAAGISARATFPERPVGPGHRGHAEAAGRVQVSGTCPLQGRPCSRPPAPGPRSGGMTMD